MTRRRSFRWRRLRPVEAILSPALALLLALAALGISPFAAADTWDRGAGTAAWSTAANWADNTEPFSADPVIFPTPVPGAAPTITLSGGENAQSLTFNDTYSLSGGNLTLHAADGPITVASGKNATISSSIFGNVGLLKGGSGTLWLTGNNTFTGDVRIVGTLKIAGNASLGNSANPVVIGTGIASGAVLESLASLTTSRAISPGIFGGAIRAETGTTFTINGALGGVSNPLTIDGFGTVALGAASTRNGSTTIQNGTVRLNNDAALGSLGASLSNGATLELAAGVTMGGLTTLNTGTALRTLGAGAVHNSVSVGSSANVTLNSGTLPTHTLTIGDIDGGSGSSTLVNGSGEIILSGAGNSYAGSWGIGGGTLRLTHADSITSSASMGVLPGGTVRAEAASNYAGGWTIAGLLRVQNATGTGVGASTLTVNALGTLQIEGVDLARNATLASNATLRGIGNATASGTITAGDSLPAVTLATGTMGADMLTVNNYTGGNGSTTLVSGSGTVVLPTASTYAGGWQINSGTLRLGHSAALGGGASAVIINNGGTLLLNQSITLARDLTMNSGSELEGTLGTLPNVNGTVSIAPGAAVRFNGGLNVSGQIVGGGSGSSITVEAGSFVNLPNSPASTYLGTWNVTGSLARLVINNDNQLGDPANPVNLNGNAQFLVNSSTTSSRVITIGSAARIDTFGTLTLNSGLAGGSGTLFVGGVGGGVVLNAASSRTGLTLIDRTSSGGAGPIVRVNNDAALGTGSVQVGGFSVISGAELQLGEGIEMDQAATLVNGTIRGHSNSTYDGTITVPIDTSTDVFLATGADAGHSLTVASYAGGNLAVTHIAGSGKVILSGANAYNGAYAVDSGTLRLTHASAISSAASPIVINNGGTLEAVVASNYAGGWQLGGGTLRVQHTDGLGSGTSTIAVGAGSTIQLNGIFLDRPVLLNDGGTLSATSISTYSESGFPKVTNADADAFITVSGINERLTIGSAIRSETAAASSATLHVNGLGHVVLSSGGTSAADVFGGSWELSNGILQVGQSVGNSINGLGFKSGDAKQANAITVNGGTLAVGVLGSGSNTPPWLRAGVTLNGLGAIASTNGVDAQHGGDFIVSAGSAPRVQLFDPVALATARSLSLVAGAAGPDNLAAATTWGAGSTLIVTPGTTSGGVFTIARSGGTISVGAGATLQVNPGATFNLGGAADALSDGTNHVRVENNSSTSFNVTQGIKNIGSLGGSGNTNISAGASLTVHQISNRTYGAITGDGALVKDGGQPLTPNSIAVGALTIADGAIGAGAPIGTVTVAGNYTQTSAGTLRIDLSSPSSFDELIVGGAATLAGNLNVSLTAGFAPSLGQSFDILDFNPATLSGTFSSISLPPLGGGLAWNTSQLYTSGTLSVSSSVALTADFDEDDDVDGDDFNQWRGDFGENDLSDADSDGDSDGADFLAWQQQFGSSPAVTAASSPVPEPATLVLLIPAAASLCARQIVRERRF